MDRMSRQDPSRKDRSSRRRRAKRADSGAMGRRGSRSRSAADDTTPSGRRPARSPWPKRLALSALLLLVALAVYTFAQYRQVSEALKSVGEDREEIAAALDTVDDTGPQQDFEYFLLLGSDRREGQTRARSDTIILARLDKRDRSVVMVSIPRDTRVEVPGHGTTKINHASAYGGVPLAIQTVKQFTGLPVHHYLEIDFDGFKYVVDALGGVRMNVDSSTRTETGRVVGTGVQTLDGEEALAVVRNRKGYADGDFARMRNQQAFLMAVANKMSQGENVLKIPGIMKSLSDDIGTNLSVVQVADIARKYGRELSAANLNGYSMPGYTQTIGGVSYVIAKQPEASELFEAIGRGETPAKATAGE